MGKLGDIQSIRLDFLRPYERNARVHDEEQIELIAKSIKEFGFLNPVLIDKDFNVIAGHGRILAAKSLGMESVPALFVEGLTEEQKRAYIIADNRLTELGGWDMDIVSDEVSALEVAGFDVSMFSFDLEDATEELDDNKYTPKVDIPQYVPSGDITFVEDLCDTRKTDELLREIQASGVSEAEKAFLTMAAYWHLKFSYSKIADYYADASPEMQELMEKSALVIVDLGNAIRDGYAELHSIIIGDQDAE